MKTILITGSTDGIGEESPVYLALSGQIKGGSGNYYVNKKEKRAASAAYNQDLQAELWNQSLKMIKDQEILNEIPDKFLRS